MAIIRRRLTPERIRVLFGIILAGVFYVELRNGAPLSAHFLPSQPAVYASEVREGAVERDSFDYLVRHNPLRALELAREDHLRSVHDYTCTFVKQELLPSGMSQEQTIAVKFRQEPYSVVMHWVRNPGKAERVVYVKNRWVDPGADEDLREQAVCQPGPIARVFIKSLKQPIHCKLAHEASRRYIDEFGFGRGLDLLIKYGRLARDRNELSLEFIGESEFDGRPTYVIERHLPYTGANGIYPDRAAIIHIDKQWHIPVSVQCYSDDAKTQLLGRYEYSDVELDAGLTPESFDPATYGM